MTEVVHPGVTVRLSGIETVISAAFKGPFKLALRKLGAITEIVLIDETDQSVNAHALSFRTRRRDRESRRDDQPEGGITGCRRMFAAEAMSRGRCERD